MSNETVAGAIAGLTAVSVAIVGYFGISKNSTTATLETEAKSNAQEDDFEISARRQTWKEILELQKIQGENAATFRIEIAKLRTDLALVRVDLESERQKRIEQVAERDMRITALEETVQRLELALNEERLDHNLTRKEKQTLVARIKELESGNWRPRTL